MDKHTFTYKITLAWLNLWGKKSCAFPSCPVSLSVHSRPSSELVGKMLWMFQNVFLPLVYHQSRTKWRSTHVKATLLRVGCVGVVSKGLYYHRFVDVLSMGNGMKWDDFLSKCVFSDYSFILMKKWKKDLNLDLCF